MMAEDGTSASFIISSQGSMAIPCFSSTSRMRSFRRCRTSEGVRGQVTGERAGVGLTDDLAQLVLIQALDPDVDAVAAAAGDPRVREPVVHLPTRPQGSATSLIRASRWLGAHHRLREHGGADILVRVVASVDEVRRVFVDVPAIAAHEAEHLEDLAVEGEVAHVEALREPRCET